MRFSELRLRSSVFSIHLGVDIKVESKWSIKPPQETKAESDS